VEEMLVKEENSGRDSRYCCLEVKISKKIKKYQDNGHSVFYTYETWTDSNLTFCKCWPNDEVMDIHTNVNSGNGFIMLHVGGINGFLPNALLIYMGGLATGDYHVHMHVTNFKKSVAKKLISNLPPVGNCPPITVSKLINYRHLTQYKQT